MAKSAIETQKMLQVILQAVGGTIVESAVSDLARYSDCLLFWGEGVEMFVHYGEVIAV